MEFCTLEDGSTDRNVAYIVLDSGILNFYCADLIAETYLPHEYEGYKFIFTLEE